jgi:hypothetical protein
MQDGRMPHGHKVTNHAWMLISQVNHGIVLNVGPGANDNAIDIPSQNRSIPNATILP